MSRKQRKLPQQTFKVSQKDLERYYSKYLPGFAYGGVYKKQSYKPLMQLGGTTNRLAGFMNRVLTRKPPLSNASGVNQRDYQKTTVTNNTGENQYYDHNDGSVETKNVALGNGLNGWGGMDNYLNDLQQVTDLQGDSTFSQSTWNRNTGEVDYTNPDPSARTINDIANKRLSGVGAQFMTFNPEGKVDSYNDGTQNVAYDPNRPLNTINSNASTTISPTTTTTTGTQHTGNTTNTTISDGKTEQQLRNEAYNNRQFGGGLRRYQGAVNPSEIPYSFDENDAFGKPNAPVTPYLLENLTNYDPQTWNSGRGATSKDLGMISQAQANADRDTEHLRNPFETETSNTSVDEFGRTFAEQMREEGEAFTQSQLQPAGSTGAGTPGAGSIETDASWGDTTGARLANKAGFLGAKVLDSTVGQGFAEFSDMAVEGAGALNEGFTALGTEKEDIQLNSGTSTDAMGSYASADSDGLYGEYNQNTGLHMERDKIPGFSAQRGLETYQDRGEVPQPSEHNTALLRQFIQMSEPTFQFTEEAINDQKKSLGQLQYGGQVLDLDEALIQELIAAGANIEIL